jgi:uncharacterized protein with HEPN domain
MRNQITHGYDSVDYAIVWQVATQQVPLLHRAVDDLLAQFDGSVDHYSECHDD